MNHMVIYIMRRGVWRWFRFWSQKIYLSKHLREKRVLKNLRGWIQKKIEWFESGVKCWFEIYQYLTKLNITSSRIADGQKTKMLHDFCLMAEKSWNVRFPELKFYADSDEKIRWKFFKILIFSSRLATV